MAPSLCTLLRLLTIALGSVRIAEASCLEETGPECTANANGCNCSTPTCCSLNLDDGSVGITSVGEDEDAPTVGLSAGAIASGVLVTVFGMLIVLADSMWLVMPHSVSAKLKDGYLMRTCYGAQCGIRHMDKFDGWFAIAVVVTAIVSVWIADSVAAAVAAEVALCIFHPWMLFVGVAMSLGGLLPGMGPMLFVVMSTVFGANVIWRAYDPSLGLPDKYVPVIVVWHVLCMLVMLVYLVGVVRTTPKIKFTIKLGQLKEEAVNAGATWIRGKDEPEGFTAPAEIVKRAADEQAALRWVPYWRTFLGLLVCFGILAGGLAGVAQVNDLQFLRLLRAFNVRDLIFINLAIMAVSGISLLYVVVTCAKGGLGRKELSEGFEEVKYPTAGMA